MKIIHEHRVPKSVISERFRSYAQKHFKKFYPSNKGIKKAIEKGFFYVNGTPANTSYFIKEGDLIELFQEETKLHTHSDLKLDIIYEDTHFAIINKASGIPVHSHGKQNITIALGSNLQQSDEVDRLVNPMPVHRLDSATSGLLIIAKTRSSQVYFGRLFEEKKILKSYLAILCGKLIGSGVFNDLIQGKSAKSKYQVIHHMKNDRLGYLSLVQLEPLTGRTHQLRIHCATAGHPVLGERKYGKEFNNLKGKGLFLAAIKLEFHHPTSREKMSFTISPPKKFRAYFKQELQDSPY